MDSWNSGKSVFRCENSTNAKPSTSIRAGALRMAQIAPKPFYIGCGRPPSLSSPPPVVTLCATLNPFAPVSTIA